MQDRRQGIWFGGIRGTSGYATGNGLAWGTLRTGISRFERFPFFDLTGPCLTGALSACTHRMAVDLAVAVGIAAALLLWCCNLHGLLAPVGKRFSGSRRSREMHGADTCLERCGHGRWKKQGYRGPSVCRDWLVNRPRHSKQCWINILL